MSRILGLATGYSARSQKHLHFIKQVTPMSLQAISPDASARPIELVCPAGSLPALKSAIDLGADCVYLGFRDATNARNFAGLNFDDAAIANGIAYAHERGRKVLLALNTY